MRRAQIPHVSAVVGTQANSRLELGDRSGAIACLQESEPQIVMCVGIFRLRFYGLAKCFDGLPRFTTMLEQQAQAVLRVRVIGPQFNTRLHLADRRSRFALALQNLCKIIVSAWFRVIQLDCSLKMLRSFLDGFFLIPQNTEMKMRRCIIRLQSEGLDKLRTSALSLRLLHQHATEFVV